MPQALKDCDVDSDIKRCLKNHYSTLIEKLHVKSDQLAQAINQSTGDPKLGAAIIDKMAGVYKTHFQNGDVEGDMGAKLKKPKAVGHAIVRDQHSNMYSTKHMVPQQGISDLRFDFFVQPPTCAEGQVLRADVAIIDQFGNEHWLKGLEFPYV